MNDSEVEKLPFMTWSETDCLQAFTRPIPVLMMSWFLMSFLSFFKDWEMVESVSSARLCSCTQAAKRSSPIVWLSACLRYLKYSLTQESKGKLLVRRKDIATLHDWGQVLHCSRLKAG